MDPSELLLLVSKLCFPLFTYLSFEPNDSVVRLESEAEPEAKSLYEVGPSTAFSETTGRVAAAAAVAAATAVFIALGIRILKGDLVGDSEMELPFLTFDLGASGALEHGENSM